MTEMDLGPIMPGKKPRPRRAKQTDVKPDESETLVVEPVAPLIVGEGVHLTQPPEEVKVPALEISIRRVPMQHIDSDPYGDLPHQSR